VASEQDKPRPRRRPGTAGTLANHLSGRVDPLTSAILVFPLFLLYQAGILASAGQNGVDFVTKALIELSARDMGNYLVVLAVMLVAYAAVLVILRKRGSFHPRAFVPVVIESTFYALTMGTLILFIMNRIGVAPGLSTGGGGPNPLDVLVISAGAGLHEELIFRVIGMGGMAWLLAGITGPRRAWLAALVVSSLAFSLAHHIGPAGEAFSFAAFTYRVLAGAFFALVYHVRGFAVAAWTHALYDVYVLSLA
jgi:hypothetical protein